MKEVLKHACEPGIGQQTELPLHELLICFTEWWGSQLSAHNLNLDIHLNILCLEIFLVNRKNFFTILPSYSPFTALRKSSLYSQV